MQLQIEEAALKKKETDNLSKGRLTELQKELSELQEDFSVKKARWDNEKAAVDKIHQLKTEIENTNNQIEMAKTAVIWSVHRNLNMASCHVCSS